MATSPALQGITRLPHMRDMGRIARKVGLVALSFSAGGVMLEWALPTSRYPWSYVQGFLLAGTLLAVGLRIIRTRTEGFLLLASFYAGSLSAIPFIWRHFFAGPGGWPAWLGLSILLALPAYLTRKKWGAVVGVVLALVLSVVPPLGFLGLGTPMLAAGAFFPGWGLLGLVLMLVFYTLSGVRHRAAVVLQVAMLGWGAMHVTAPPPVAPALAWAATTYMGDTTGQGLGSTYAKIDRVQHLASEAIDQGAKVIVLPEGSDTMWGPGQVFYWKTVASKAQAAGATVLIGAYSSSLMSDSRRDGLVDLTSNTFYPAQVTIPFAMWKPWDEVQFPLQWGTTKLIPTAAGKAAYQVCYEELLVWPLATRAMHGADFVVAAANQWFARGWLLRAQERSGKIQARLWGLPVVRSVNYSEVP